jgi:hypothetical protein
MTRIATEPASSARARRRTPARVRFCALDGPVQVVIEADHEDDARHLCREMGFAFIRLCDG